MTTTKTKTKPTAEELAQQITDLLWAGDIDTATGIKALDIVLDDLWGVRYSEQREDAAARTGHGTTFVVASISGASHMSLGEDLPVFIPEGLVLVHEGPDDIHFGGWLSVLENEELEPCPCDWAPGLGQHYRLRLADVREVSEELLSTPRPAALDAR